MKTHRRRETQEKQLRVGRPSLQSLVSLSWEDGTEKKRQEVTQRGRRVEETPGHKSSISGNAFQRPSSKTGNLSLASGFTSAINLQVPGAHQRLDGDKAGSKKKKRPKPEGAGGGVGQVAEAHSRGTVLDPRARHFLLVDDVHQLDRVCTLHIHHRPLERVF